jgi:hypothetical protein
MAHGLEPGVAIKTIMRTTTGLKMTRALNPMALGRVVTASEFCEPEMPAVIGAWGDSK